MDPSLRAELESEPCRPAEPAGLQLTRLTAGHLSTSGLSPPPFLLSVALQKAFAREALAAFEIISWSSVPGRRRWGQNRCAQLRLLIPYTWASLF